MRSRIFFLGLFFSSWLPVFSYSWYINYNPVSRIFQPHGLTFLPGQGARCSWCRPCIIDRWDKNELHIPVHTTTLWTAVMTAMTSFLATKTKANSLIILKENGDSQKFRHQSLNAVEISNGNPLLYFDEGKQLINRMGQVFHFLRTIKILFFACHYFPRLRDSPVWFLWPYRIFGFSPVPLFRKELSSSTSCRF